MGESAFTFRGIGENFISISFLMKIMKANRIAPDGTTRFAASHLGLFCMSMPMSHEKDTKLIWVKRANPGPIKGSS